MITKLESEAELDAALLRIEEIWKADIDSDEGVELDRLVDLVVKYEDTHYPINQPSAKAVMQFRREQEAMPAFQLTCRKYYKALRKLAKK